MKGEPTAEERERSAARLGAAKRGEGRGGWSREVLTPSSGDDVDFCVVAILGVGEQRSSYGTHSITAPLLPNTPFPVLQLLYHIIARRALGQRIHELRDKADLSLRGSAKKIGISSPFLSDIELGRRFPWYLCRSKVSALLQGLIRSSRRDPA